MNPFPSYYCPPGVKPPAHCPHPVGRALIATASPDGAEGLFYGGGQYDLETKGQWVKTSAGWWFLLGNHEPTHLMRMETSPRILRWHIVQGAEADQWWRVPVLLTPADDQDRDNPAKGYVSALDRIWRGDGWDAPSDLRAAQEKLLATVGGIALADDLEQRNRAFIALAIDILAFGHHVSEAEMVAQGWMTEALMERIILTATDRVDLARPTAPAPATETGD